MDPLSISSAIVALSHVTSTVIQCLIDMKEATGYRKKILNEVSSAAGLLFVLKDLASRSKETKSWCTTIGALNLPDGPLEQYKTSMESLLSILSTDNSSDLKIIQKSLAWPYQKSQVSDILSTIERQKSTFALALHDYHL
jgi:hypothetical protein